MNRLARGALSALVIASFGISADDQIPWPAEDTPHPSSVSVGLAGDVADVTRYLLVRGAEDFSISPDGQRIAYVSSVTGQPQLWLVNSKGGAPEQITWGSGIESFAWTPDNGSFIYGADTGGDERLGLNLLSADGKHERILVEKSSAYRLLGGFSSDGRRVAFASTERNGRDFDIHVADTTTGSSRLVLKGVYSYSAEKWRPESSEVLVSQSRGEHGNNLYLLNVDTGVVRTLAKPAVASLYSSLAWLPDGSGFYLVSNQDRDLAAVAFYSLKRGALRYVETPEQEVSELALSGDGRFLAWLTNDFGFHQLHVRDLKTRAELKVPELPQGELKIAFAHDVPNLAVLVNGPRAPGEIHVWNLETGELTTPVRVADAGLHLSAMTIPERVSFIARDGVRLSGLFYLPNSTPEKGLPPVLLAVHGGPTSQASSRYQADKQFYAAHGIAVFDLNYRGSKGFGKRFEHLNDKKLRVNELGDIVDAVAWLRQSGRVDTKRTAIGGRSYGGYLTNAALGAYPDLFVAGISAVGVSNWVTALQEADPAVHAVDIEEFGDIADPAVRKFVSKLSPINNAAKIKAPVLIEHGVNDPRDPVTESDRLVQAIRASGGTAIYLRFPNEGHHLKQLANRIFYYQQTAAFLETQFGMRSLPVSTEHAYVKPILN